MRIPNLRHSGVHLLPVKHFHAFNLTTLLLLRHGTAVFSFLFFFFYYFVFWTSSLMYWSMKECIIVPLQSQTGYSES